jgi:hypothetical protein
VFALQRQAQAKRHHTSDWVAYAKTLIRLRETLRLAKLAAGKVCDQAIKAGMVLASAQKLWSKADPDLPELLASQKKAD